MQINSPRYNANGTIDCEVEHPSLGMIPYTASSGTSAKFGAAVWLQLQSMDVAPYVPLTDAVLLKQAKRQARQALNSAYEEAARELIWAYPESERLSWSIQLAEAEAYLAWLDTNQYVDEPATPTLSSILSGRNGVDGTETLNDLALAVLERAKAFQAWQRYTGIRQRGEMLIQSATTPDSARAVTWESLLKEA